MQGFCAGILAVITMGAGMALAQAPAQTGTQPSTAYQPKFPGDPARSDSEAQALAYMRTLLRAQREYKKRHDKFADSLAALAGTASFTKRLAQSTDRGDYTVSFRTHKDGFVLTMTPNHMDSEHRSFYAEDDMVIHADDQKAADSESPKVK
jgi:type II secretory pathway pseudopilin PulG